MITTHYIEEARQAHVVGFMRDGRMLEEGTPDDLIEKYHTESLEDTFLHLCHQHSQQTGATSPTAYPNSTDYTAEISIEAKQQATGAGTETVARFVPDRSTGTMVNRRGATSFSTSTSSSSPSKPLSHNAAGASDDSRVIIPANNTQHTCYNMKGTSQQHTLSTQNAARDSSSPSSLLLVSSSPFLWLFLS